MNTYLRSISATLSGDIISLDIKAEDEDYDKIIESKVYPNNTFRFSYIHPENDKANKYTGFIERSKVYIYPQHGEATITQEYIQL